MEAIRKNFEIYYTCKHKLILAYFGSKIMQKCNWNAFRGKWKFYQGRILKRPTIGDGLCIFLVPLLNITQSLSLNLAEHPLCIAHGDENSPFYS